MKKPVVSIITVNYKQAAVTCELLDSIQQLTYPHFEVIIVDNAQEGDDTELYRSHLENVIVINSPENLGFAGGNNLGIQAAKGDFLFLVNNDTELNDGAIESLLKVLKNPKIGAVSPVLRYFDCPEKIQYAGFTKINPITGRNELVQEKPQETGSVATAYIHGAAVMLRREVIEKCGLMPEDYFLYYEELAWSENILEQGFELRVCLNTYVLHKESISTGKNSPLKTYYLTRNRLLFMNKRKTFERFLFNLFSLFVSIPKNLILHTLRREFIHRRAYIQGLTDALYRRVGIRKQPIG